MTIRALPHAALALLASACLAAVGGCGADAPEDAIEASVHADAAGAAVGTAPEEALSAVMGATEIPYPIYPNGKKYRVGGENGLKIVVFQTEDSFDEVDEYYRTVSAEQDMPRLMAMTDYVRYPSDAGDEDPWATYRPGIVIHEFDGEEARIAAGAGASARTNIIMSY